MRKNLRWEPACQSCALGPFSEKCREHSRLLLRQVQGRPASRGRRSRLNRRESGFLPRRGEDRKGNARAPRKPRIKLVAKNRIGRRRKDIDGLAQLRRALRRVQRAGGRDPLEERFEERRTLGDRRPQRVGAAGGKV